MSVGSPVSARPRSTALACGGLFSGGSGSRPSRKGGHRQVVQINEPFLQQPSPENIVHQPLENLWPVQGAERQAHGQVNTAKGDHRQGLPSPPCVWHMIKAGDCVEHRDQARRSDPLLLIVTSRDEERATHGPRVHLSIVDNHSHLRMTHNEGRAEPLLVALAGYLLSPKQILRNTPLESILILSFQAVGGLPHGQPRNLNIMLKAL